MGSRVLPPEIHPFSKRFSMKNLRYATCFLCLFTSLTMFAQNKTWLGATFGFTNDDYQIESASVHYPTTKI